CISALIVAIMFNNCFSFDQKQPLSALNTGFLHFIKFNFSYRLSLKDYVSQLFNVRQSRSHKS
ncbi:hypothetical protein L7I36_22905, partial [Obesumbacterium proteus]|uniref:hypothetical protein n=1 Tax=Obesumbacterium proteus TaxID=82983 RepID=UPI001EDC1C3D